MGALPPPTLGLELRQTASAALPTLPGASVGAASARMSDLKINGMTMRYSQFMPRLYNLCLALGFQRGRILPSRAFCSDETQGYPTILIAQHFGTFPFDHGSVGGRVATDRHGPHADHGDDLVIIHATHVGYDSECRSFGSYERLLTASGKHTHNCGKLCAVMQWYRQEYDYARANVLLGLVEDQRAIFIDNHLLDQERGEGLFLHLDSLIGTPALTPLRALSTSKAFPACNRLVQKLPSTFWQEKRQPIGEGLTPDLFFFRRDPCSGPDGHDLLERGLAPAMPALMVSPYPALDAARFTTQVEFDRVYRSLQRDPAYHGKNLLFVSRVNIDVSPRPGLPFPLTKFVPWAAYVRLRDQDGYVLEQLELFDALSRQPSTNPDQTSFDAAIHAIAPGGVTAGIA